MDIDALAKEFQQVGYLLVPGFFSRDLMGRLHHLILEHFGEAPDYVHDQAFLKKSATEVIPWFPQLDGVPAFDQLENDARLMALTEALLGESWRALYCMTMYSKPDSGGQAWHQDCFSSNNRHFNLNRLVYTMDIDPQTGGQLVVKPGSHLLGKITVGAAHEDFSDQLVLSPNQGDLVLIHGHTWHRVLPVKACPRVSTNFRAIPKGTPEDITDVCVYRNMRYQFSTNSMIEDRIN